MKTTECSDSALLKLASAAKVAETKLALFEVQGKGMRVHSTVFDKPGFDKAPYAFDAVDVGLLRGELILSITNVNQAIVAPPAT